MDGFVTACAYLKLEKPEHPISPPWLKALCERLIRKYRSLQNDERITPIL
jgi:hypothetical protein